MDQRVDSPNQDRYMLLERKVQRLRTEIRLLKRRERWIVLLSLRDFLRSKINQNMHRLVRRTPFSDAEKAIIATRDKCTINSININLICLTHDWLTDEIINNYLKLLNHSKVYCVSTFFYEKISTMNDGDYDDALGFFKNIKVLEQHAILFPLHVRNNHWCLVCANMRSRQLYAFDSLSRNSKEQKLVYEKIKLFMIYLTLDLWTLVDLGTGVAQQENLDDCGVYCCIFSLLLAEHYKTSSRFPRNLDHFQFSAHDAYTMRREIKLKLCNIG